MVAGLRGFAVHTADHVGLRLEGLQKILDGRQTARHSDQRSLAPELFRSRSELRSGLTKPLFARGHTATVEPLLWSSHVFTARMSGGP